MSLNKFMHPRNRYKNAKPSFLHLALKYSQFRAHITQDERGKVFLDFKNADALRALTTCLLKEDFDLDVNLPSNRLVPTLPLRLNYIHWLEDIIGISEDKWGIDLGTGASCVYPLLAAKTNKWHFLATEADVENVFHAKQNVEANGLKDLIHVQQVSTDDVLIGPLESFSATAKFDFCMCNPPFFADHMEAQAVTNSRSVDRPDAGSVSTASPQESIVHGGEAGFIRQMIEESALLRDKIRVYTSMVGRKSSLPQLKEDLRHMNVTNFAITEFCQGKTMRWGIAWTYDNSMTFPKSHFESRKEKPPLQYMIPKGAGGVQYNVHDLAAYLRSQLESFKIHCYQGKKAKSYTSITITAVANTWCHQRRLRRQEQRKQQLEEKRKLETWQSSNNTSTSTSPDKKESDSDQACTDRPIDSSEPDCINSSGNTEGGGKRPSNTPEDNAVPSKRMKEENSMNKDTSDREGLSINNYMELEARNGGVTTVGTNFVKDVTINDKDCATNEKETLTTQSDTSPKEYILKCVMRLKRIDEQVQLELEWLDGQSRELLHQIMTFMKNKLNVEKK